MCVSYHTIWIRIFIICVHNGFYTYRLPIAHSKEKYQSVFDGFNEEGNVLWEDLERLYSQVSPYDGNDVINGRRRRYRESPLPKAMNPFLFPGGKKTKK